MERWYALHTKPHKEQHVLGYLLSHEIEGYLPAIQVPNKRYPRRKREEPFFARYLFAHVDLTRVALSSINWAPGMIGVVGSEGEPLPLPDDVIVHLRRRIALLANWDPQAPLLHENDVVRIMAGPLAGLEAIFDRRLSSQDRARVLVEFMGHLTTAEVDLDSLELVRASKSP